MEDDKQRIRKIVNTFCSVNTPLDSMKFVLELDNMLYSILGTQSVRYGGGLHTKHKHINYHKFFVDNILNGESVLDLGCGIGAVAHSIAKERAESEVLGIDLKVSNITKANSRYCRRNLTFLVGNALEVDYSSGYGVIVLSNVLEHFKGRVTFLKKLFHKVRPNKVLIRVPVFERDWKVPLKKELGLDFMLDSTHVVECSQDKWIREFEEAGMQVSNSKVCWGELWVVGRSL